MARKLRIEFPGAVYHIYNRGNYRRELFVEDGNGQAFEKALLEAAECSDWLIHAYTIMSNHYHLLLETPEPTLIAGMKWLQGVFANRFNRFRNERGHVFEGRYHAILVEPGSSLRRVADYIHLNPVRAGLVSLENLKHCNLSSYPKFWMIDPPDHLVRSAFLGCLNLPDNLDGMLAYESWLAKCDEADPLKEDELKAALQSGWLIGSDEYRDHVLEKFAEFEMPPDWNAREPHDFFEHRWEALTVCLLQRLGKSEEDLSRSPKLVEWKADISRILRTRTNATNGWIAKRLHMGHLSNVSHCLRKNPKSKG